MATSHRSHTARKDSPSLASPWLEPGRGRLIPSASAIPEMGRAEIHDETPLEPDVLIAAPAPDALPEPEPALTTSPVSPAQTAAKKRWTAPAWTAWLLLIPLLLVGPCRSDGDDSSSGESSVPSGDTAVATYNADVAPDPKKPRGARTLQWVGDGRCHERSRGEIARLEGSASITDLGSSNKQSSMGLSLNKLDGATSSGRLTSMELPGWWFDCRYKGKNLSVYINSETRLGKNLKAGSELPLELNVFSSERRLPKGWEDLFRSVAVPDQVTD